MVVAKASGDMMFFVVVLLEEALFSIDNVGGRSRWSSHDGRGSGRVAVSRGSQMRQKDGTRAGPHGRILEI
jgi:hypothetical protein